MATEEITTPSGLSVVVRGLKGKEMAQLANVKGATKSKRHPLDAVFDGCWLETIDAGPYGPYGVQVGKAEDGVKPPPWLSVLMCDRFHLFLRIRACTWGDGYEYKVRCPNTDCVKHKKSFVWEVPLSELPFKPLPKASIEKVKAKDLIFPCDVGGAAGKFKLLNGADEMNLGKLEEGVSDDQKLLAQISSRLISVDGIADADRLTWLGELDWPVLVGLGKQFEAVDGGIETRTTIVCPECETEWASDIPFDVQSFLLGKTK